jgi:hypothetical protein
MNMSFNPNLTSNAAGGFNIETTGYIAGMAYWEPATRYQLSGGPLASSETLPMWGGLPIVAEIPQYSSYALTTGTPPVTTAGSPIEALGTPIIRSVASADIVGFSVFNSDHAMINSPQSPVPLAAPGMQVNYFKLGSLARIALPVDPAIATLVGSSILSSCSWDYANLRVGAYQASYADNALSTPFATWASTSGGQVTFTTATSHGVTVGSSFVVSGVVPSGYNGVYTAITGTTGATLVAVKAANPGTYSSGGKLNAGGGALSVKILDFNIGGSMVPSYDSSTGFCTWNRSGNAVLVMI